MSNCIEYMDKMVFHPGYYIGELVENSGLTQEDFAKRLDTTPKNLSKLVNGEQSLSIEIAMKLNRLTGISVNYWFNLQSAYDAMLVEQQSDMELDKEKEVFKELSYSYFVKNFNLPKIERDVVKKIVKVRNFLNVSTLQVLANRNMAVNFRSAGDSLSKSNVIKGNVMVQIAVNETLKASAPRFDKQKFDNAVKYALTLTKNHDEFYSILKDKFAEAGVIFVILPNCPGSKINGATKKVGHNIMMMVNDRRCYADTFWFTLFHEIAHIKNFDYGISCERENIADKYAADMLVPPEQYRIFLRRKCFDKCSIESFAKTIDRDPGIVLGRLEYDGYVSYGESGLRGLKHKYHVLAKF